MEEVYSAEHTEGAIDEELGNQERLPAGSGIWAMRWRMSLHCLVAVVRGLWFWWRNSRRCRDAGSIWGTAFAFMWLEDRSQVRRETLLHILVSEFELDTSWNNGIYQRVWGRICNIERLAIEAWGWKPLILSFWKIAPGTREKFIIATDDHL